MVYPRLTGRHELPLAVPVVPEMAVMEAPLLVLPVLRPSAISLACLWAASEAFSSDFSRAFTAFDWAATATFSLPLFNASIRWSARLLIFAGLSASPVSTPLADSSDGSNAEGWATPGWIDTTTFGWAIRVVCG